MKKILTTYTLLLAAFLSVVVFASYAGKTEEESTDNILPQIVKPVDLNKPFDFAGEPVPMDNFDVRERLDRELLTNTYWHSTTMLHIKNTYKYFPLIEKVLAENGIPDDFKYLAVAESSLRNEVSPKGARGIWQFMGNTGDYYGLEISAEVDERYHLEKATKAACDYLKGYKKRFGDWTLSAAAYNMGGTRLAKDIKAQRADNYYDLNLNSETSRYVFRVIAIKEVLKNPRAFGFYLEADEAYPPISDYDLVEVKGAIESLADFAIEHGTTYRMIKVYNPWLISSKLTNKEGKTYQIKVPRKKS